MALLQRIALWSTRIGYAFFPSWPDLSGPSIAARACGDGPDKPGHDEKAYAGISIGLRLAIAALLLAHPAAAADAHRDLSIGVASFPSTLHPAIDPDLIKFYLLGFADRPVTTHDASGQVVCLLCTEVPSLANGGARLEGDGMAVTFRFRPGLQWGDGAPLGAEDLAFTARVGHDPNSGFADTHAWAIISHVDVVDPQTAVVHFAERNYQFDQLGQILPAHLEAAVFDRAKGPAAYMQQSNYNTAPTNPGLYNGPYLITGFDTGARVVLERNPRWQGAKPFFDRIAVKTIGNTAALQSNLLSGDVDMVPGEGIGLTLDQVLALQKQYPDRFVYTYKPNMAYTHIDLQLDNPILADSRVRRALLMGIDRKSMVDKLMGGRVAVANSFASPQQPVYSADAPAYPYDPARARALLAEAGWTPGPDGICRNAAGQRLTLEFATSTGVRVRELLQQVMQSEWRRIGVETIIHNEPPRTLFGETLKHRAFKGLAMFAWVSGIESSPRQTLSSGQIPTSANNWGGGNYPGFHDATMDADIDAMEKELDPARRRPLWTEMQRLYAEQLPVLPLFYGADAHVWPVWLKGVAPTGFRLSTLSVEDWRAE
ncbi:MAG: peptide ABC transporter substrate-binding protein [Rhodopila sp.]